jgi:hypothetical protein
MASKVIRLVRNDYGDALTWTLTQRETGAVVDLTNASTVKMYFRAKGGTTILATLTLSIVAPATSGQVRLVWPISTLNQTPGFYEGEIEITLVAGGTKTLNDLQQFYIREDVGP